MYHDWREGVQRSELSELARLLKRLYSEYEDGTLGLYLSTPPGIKSSQESINSPSQLHLSYYRTDLP